MTLHIASDMVIFVSYVSLAAWCWLVLRSKGPTIRVLFGLFILFCGITHLDAAISEMRGVCEVGSLGFGLVKALTAVVSGITAVFASILLTGGILRDPAVLLGSTRDVLPAKSVPHFPEYLVRRHWVITALGHSVAVIIGVAIGFVSFSTMLQKKILVTEQKIIANQQQIIGLNVAMRGEMSRQDSLSTRLKKLEETESK